MATRAQFSERLEAIRKRQLSYIKKLKEILDQQDLSDFLDNLRQYDLSVFLVSKSLQNLLVEELGSF